MASAHGKWQFVVDIKMIKSLQKIKEAQIEKVQKMFKKELQDLKNKQTEMNNTITEI